MSINNRYIVITDIGSTTTKGLLLEQVDGILRFIAEDNVPTTVEKPNEDVKIGLRELMKRLEQKTNLSLTDDQDRIKVTYLTTSSAGGGLQILVFGLSAVETGSIAEMTAYGAGGVILKTFTVDDHILPIDKMRLMQELHPDMVLMAGGLDDGAISGVVELSELLSIANPTPKFRKNEKIPLVFCGNIVAQDFVTNILDKSFDVYTVDNVRPNMHEINIEPARNMVHRLFMENVMEQAPGYSELKNWTSIDIIPTPVGVENILKLYAKETIENIVMVDMGGATTDIFSIIAGECHRTVAANIGMSYSISNIMAEAGIDKIFDHLPVKIDENDVGNYIANKSLNPTYNPTHKSEEIVEYATAIEGLRIAWDMHKDMNFKIAQIGFLDRRKLIKDINQFEDLFKLQVNKQYFQLSNINLLIGAGGIFAHTDSQTKALQILADGFLPSGVTKIAIDKSFKSPHMGVLSTIDEGNALTLFQEDCLEHIGYIIAPIGKIKPKKIVIEIKDRRDNKTYILKGRDILLLKNGGDFEIIPGKNILIDPRQDILKLKTNLPVLFDCRGRGEYFIDGSLAHSSIAEFKDKIDRFSTDVRAVRTEITTYDERIIERRLPYEGEIFSEIGDKMVPNTIIGENKFAPPKLYIINIYNLIGYGKKITEKEIEEGLLVNVGDKVRMGQRIFRAKTGLMGSVVYYTSPIRGKVTRIEDSGLIVLREIQDYDGKPKSINVAKQLGINPRSIHGHLRFREGDFVEKGQALAANLRQGIIVKSPITGTIKKIDAKTGKVTVQYDIKPISLKSFAKGEVVDIRKGLSVSIKTKGTIIYGMIGFGNENSGEIRIVTKKSDIDMLNPETIVVSFNSIDEDFLRKCAQVDVAGIIAPSINYEEWVNFYGQEMGIAVTGDEDIPFTLMLTEGFGEYTMNDKYSDVIKAEDGKTASISGRTQIRAGVIRPMLIIFE